MSNQIGGLALKNFIKVEKELENLSVPIGLHAITPNKRDSVKYELRINQKYVDNNLFDNMISLMKPSPFRQSRKNKLKLNKKTRKNKKK